MPDQVRVFVLKTLDGNQHELKIGVKVRARMISMSYGQPLPESRDFFLIGQIARVSPTDCSLDLRGTKGLYQLTGTFVRSLQILP